MIIKKISKIGYKEYEGALYYKWIVADPREELKVFINDKGYCIKRAVRTSTGRIREYVAISKFFKTIDEAKKYRNYLITNSNGMYDYVIIDFLYNDDQYIENYKLSDEALKDIIVEGEQ